MIRTTALAAALAAMTGSALASVERVAEVEVVTDITAIQNERAAAYWVNLETDLEAAILTRIVDRTAEEGAKIRVLIREIELANAFERTYNLSDAVLVGRVIVTDPTDGRNDNVYDLSLSLQGAPQMVAADGTPVVVSTIDTPEAYRALVEAYADNIVQRLD
ncbi:MAG: hypothetical protein KF887_19100 [Paracoccaceae bacterium]|nr:MAG: hypothetical protein KF887_19100 [Paracoccaceae bacterium]